jgi:tRNA(fMet)-specific endonuclease VapC
MIRYLLDTNILSEPLKVTPNQHVVNKLNHYCLHCSTATLVIQEMIFGYQSLPISKRRRKIEQYVNKILNATVIFPYSTDAAIWHGKERARLKAIGKTPAIIDGQIAAIAKVNNLVLVTRNTADFKYFLDIQIENWFVE